MSVDCVAPGINLVGAGVSLVSVALRMDLVEAGTSLSGVALNMDLVEAGMSLWVLPWGTLLIDPNTGVLLRLSPSMPFTGFTMNNIPSLAFLFLCSPSSSSYNSLK